MQTIKPKELNLRLNEAEQNIAKLFLNQIKLEEEIQEIRRFLGDKFGRF